LIKDNRHAATLNQPEARSPGVAVAANYAKRVPVGRIKVAVAVVTLIRDEPKQWSWWLNLTEET